MSSFSVDRWVQTWRLARLSGDPLPWFERLAAGYTEPHRFYHTGRHVEECLDECTANHALATNPAALELAIWFHDVVYNPRATDNEECSADLAGSFLGSHGAGASLVERVRELILTTKHHPLTGDSDTALMLDIDLQHTWRVSEPVHRVQRANQTGVLVGARAVVSGKTRGGSGGSSSARANLPDL